MVQYTRHSQCHPQTLRFLGDPHPPPCPTLPHPAPPCSPGTPKTAARRPRAARRAREEGQEKIGSAEQQRRPQSWVSHLWLGDADHGIECHKRIQGNIRLTNHVLILGLSESVGEKTKSTLVNDNLSLLNGYINGYNLGYAPFSDTPISKHRSYFTCKKWRTCFKEQIRIFCLTT